MCSNPTHHCDPHHASKERCRVSSRRRNGPETQPTPFLRRHEIVPASTRAINWSIDNQGDRHGRCNRKSIFECYAHDLDRCWRSENGRLVLWSRFARLSSNGVLRSGLWRFLIRRPAQETTAAASTRLAANRLSRISSDHPR